MAGTDETQARATLAAMQSRLGQGPHVVFGLGVQPNSEEVRAAFLVLAKIYHPAKFARMSAEVQRQSNEVFLGIKAALEAITKSTQLPTANGRGSGPQRQLSQPLPTNGAAPTRPGSQPIPTIPNAQKPTTPMRPVTPPGHTATPIARPGTPPTATAQPIARPGQPAPARTVAPAQQPRAAAPPVGAKPNARGSAFDERAQLASAFELIQKQQWDGAKAVLETLIAQAPDTRQYRALLCYAAGRRAQLEKRLDDARVELNQALMIDPDLTLAKSALAELFNRRK